MKTATEHDLSDEDQSGHPPVAPVPLVAFHPGGKHAKSNRKADGAKESVLGAKVDVIVTYEAFSTFTLLHFGKNSAEGTVIYTGNEDESILLEPAVLIETVETLYDSARETTLELVLENGTYTWNGSAAEFVSETLHNKLETVVGKKPGTGLKLLTTRNPVKLT